MKNVLSFSIGIETIDGAISILIPRNIPIPYRKQQIITTSLDGQTDIQLELIECENDNKLLGFFYFSRIASAPRGVSQITIILNINSNGVLKISSDEANIRIEKERMSDSSI